MTVSARATPVRPHWGIRIVRCTVAASLALGAVASCAPETTNADSSGSGDRVVVLTTATAHEPRPMLTDRARAALRTAAESDNVSAGPGGKGSVALVTTADSEVRERLPLTPRRANGAVEYGMQREKLIEDNVRRVSEAVLGTRAGQPGLDLLQGIEDTTAGSDPGVLILVSNGLSTDGGFDLRQVGWEAEPDQIVAELRERGLLPDLAGWRVLFTGLGSTAGDQPSLPKPTRDKLTAYWQAICAAVADSCEFDDTRFERTPPGAGPEMPIVPLPDVTSVTGPRGEVTTTISDRVLGFAADSSALSPAALDLLRETATQINTKLSGQPDAPITVRGYTADPPGSTQEGRQRLSQKRAQAVADALAAAGVRNPVVAVGGAAAPGLTAVHHGVFDETRAVVMRRVEITY